MRRQERDRRLSEQIEGPVGLSLVRVAYGFIGSGPAYAERVDAPSELAQGFDLATNERVRRSRILAREKSQLLTRHQSRARSQLVSDPPMPSLTIRSGSEIGFQPSSSRVRLLSNTACCVRDSQSE